MDHDRGESVVAAAIDAWSSTLEDVLLGTSDAAAIVGMLDAFCGRALGADLDVVTFYRRGVGAVFGVLLTDGRRIVVKVHRPELVSEGLEGVRAVGRRLADESLPAPKPLGHPYALGNGVAAAEMMLDLGETLDAHDESVRQVLAAGLYGFVEAASPVLGDVLLPLAHPFNLARDRLWPTPHDLRFDFSLPGAEWVDKAAEEALSSLQRPKSRMVVGHADWRIENVRMNRTKIVAIFDWDSVCACPEAALVGANSANFTSDWSDSSIDPYPSPEEMHAFVRDYELARGSTFTLEERRTADAARTYRLAYSARCEHSDSILELLPSDPDHGWGALLRELT
jgi:hypothetical protein